MLNAPAYTQLCEGDSILFSTDFNSTDYKYLWSTGDTVSSIYVTQPGKYYYIVQDKEDTLGCYGKSNEVWVSRQPLPDIQISVSDSIVCAGTEIILSASGADTYTWSNGISNGTAFVPENTDIYTVTAIDTNGCQNTATQHITVNALPLTPIITAADSEFISSASSGNQWYFEGELIAGATQQTYTPTQDGNYHVVVTDMNNCEAQSDIYKFSETGIATNTLNAGIIIYPNPTSGMVYFSTQPNSIEVTDVLGKTVLTATKTDKIDLSKHGSGIYFISFFDQSGNRIQHNKIVKE